MISSTIRNYEKDIPKDKAIRISEYDLGLIQPSSLYHFRMGRYVIYVSVTPKTHEYRVIMRGTPPFPEKKRILHRSRYLDDCVISFYSNVEKYINHALGCDEVYIDG